MNKYFNRLLVLAVTGVALTACEENSWNDKLDGFEVPEKDQSETVNFTMAAVDYAQLANLSANKTLAGDAKADALKAVGTQGYFTPEITAEEYLPAFLGQPTFPYFSLPEGSAVKVTYRTTEGQPEQVKGVLAAEKYTVSEADYQTVWGSDEDYTEAFTPSKPAARNIPTLLKSAYPDATEGTYVIVNYKTSATDPVFSGSEEPKFELSSVLGTAATGQTLDVNGYVSAIDNQGFIITDNSGSLYCYRGSNYNDGSIVIGTQMTISGTVASRNKSIQFGNAATFEIKGKQTVTYPAPKTFTGAELDALVGGASIPAATFVSMTGKVVLSGSNINLEIAGATTAKGSPSYCPDEFKALLTDGAEVTVEGYWYAVAGNRYCSICVTKVTPVSAASAASRAVTVASTSESAVYYFDGTTWASPSDIRMLSHADYQAMGQTYDNLSGTAPEELLPIYLKQNLPYAAEGDLLYLVYTYYNGSANVTRCDECKYDGSQWNIGFDNTTIVTSQFVKKNGSWKYSPDVTITLPAGRNIEISTLYFQACVDWVLNNVPDGKDYVTSYGNNDYYTGASAYQGNVDLRPDKAIAQNPTAYAGMSDDEVVALMKKRFQDEVLPAVLAQLNPDAAPTSSGVEPLYTVNFYYYTGTTEPATIVYRVVAPRTFEFESATW